MSSPNFHRFRDRKNVDQTISCYMHGSSVSGFPEGRIGSLGQFTNESKALLTTGKDFSLLAVKHEMLFRVLKTGPSVSTSVNAEKFPRVTRRNRRRRGIRRAGIDVIDVERWVDSIPGYNELLESVCQILSGKPIGPRPMESLQNR
jgi:hypothetical protein